MSAGLVVANYETLAALTLRMREAATSGEWDTLVNIERERSELLAATKPLDAQIKLDPASSQRKDQLLKTILAQDAETQVLVKSWMDQFQMTMQSATQEMRLLKKYGG